METRSSSEPNKRIAACILHTLLLVTNQTAIFDDEGNLDLGATAKLLKNLMQSDAEMREEGSISYR